MPKIVDPETNLELFWGFETALQQLKSEKLKGEILKP